MNELTPGIKRKLAEMDGWKLHASADNLATGYAEPDCWIHENDEIPFCYADFPVEWTRDELVRLICKVCDTNDLKAKFIDALASVLNQDHEHIIFVMFAMATATPQQLATALIAAGGKK